MNKKNWIVIDFNNDLTLKCKRCNECYIPSMPAPIDIFIAINDAFYKLHQDCIEPVPMPTEGAPMKWPCV